MIHASASCFVFAFRWTYQCQLAFVLGTVPLTNQWHSLKKCIITRGLQILPAGTKVHSDSHLYVWAVTAAQVIMLGVGAAMCNMV